MTALIPENTSVLISRTDSIGDVILTIPLTFALKKYFPKNKIVFLCSAYTKPILQYIQSIDEILVYEEIKHLPAPELKNVFASLHIHTALIVFPAYEVCKLLYTAQIPYRISTSHRWYNWLFCNKLVSFSRRHSDLHEAQLNFKVLKPLNIQMIPTIAELVYYYALKPLPPLSDSLKNLLNPEKFKLIIHPKSKGSAREWGIKNYIHLINSLDTSKFQIILTGTQTELPYLQDIIQHCPQVLNLAGKTSLHELMAVIHHSDALVAASTGTLHIAAMLGKHAIGLFPSIRPMHAGRWAPIGKHTHIIQQDKECTDCKNKPAECHCIQSISPQQIYNILQNIIHR